MTQYDNTLNGWATWARDGVKNTVKDYAPQFMQDAASQAYEYTPQFIKDAAWYTSTIDAPIWRVLDAAHFWTNSAASFVGYGVREGVNQFVESSYYKAYIKDYVSKETLHYSAGIVGGGIKYYMKFQSGSLWLEVAQGAANGFWYEYTKHVQSKLGDLIMPLLLTAIEVGSDTVLFGKILNEQVFKVEHLVNGVMELKTHDLIGPFAAVGIVSTSLSAKALYDWVFPYQDEPIPSHETDSADEDLDNARITTTTIESNFKEIEGDQAQEARQDL